MGPVALAAVPAFATDLGHVRAVAADRLATFATDLGHVLAIFAHCCAALASDLGHVLAVAADCFASFATDPRHVATILANGLTTFSPGFAGLFGRKLVRPALDVGCFSPLARDLALPLLIHRGEAAPRLFRHDALLWPGVAEANGVPLRVALCWVSLRQVPQAAARIDTSGTKAALSRRFVLSPLSITLSRTMQRANVFGPRTLGALLLSSAIGLAACRDANKNMGDAAPPPSLNSKRENPSERAKDELWRRAGEGDEIDLARLADREGAGGLLEGLEEGGAIGRTALEALPFADDGEAALQRLGEILRQIDPGESEPIVRAVTGIALRRRRQTEPLDPPGVRSCALALLDIAQKTSLAGKVRAPAISALRLLAERNAVDAGAIPTDLDAK
jgi:hypothetical protein